MRVRWLVLTLVALACPTSAPAEDKKPHKELTAQVFGLDKVWSMHLIIQPKDWERMQPTKGGFGLGRGRPNQRPEAQPAESAGDRKARGSFSFDFAYVKGRLEIDVTYTIRPLGAAEALALVAELNRIEGVQGVELKGG